MIPKILHFYWANRRIPAQNKRLIDHAREVFDGWDVRIWSDNHRPTLMNEARFRDPSGIVAPEWETRFKSNLLRVELLWQYGGVWSDADMYWLKAPDQEAGFFASYAREDSPAVNLSVMGAEPFADMSMALMAAGGRIMPSPVRTGTAATLWSMAEPEQRNPLVLPWQTFHGLSRTGEILVDPNDPAVYGYHLWGSQTVNFDQTIDDITARVSAESGN